MGIGIGARNIDEEDLSPRDSDNGKRPHQPASNRGRSTLAVASRCGGRGLGPRMKKKKKEKSSPATAGRAEKTPERPRATRWPTRASGQTPERS